MIQRRIPGWYRVQQAILLFTALGVVIHELAHKEMAQDFDLSVEEVKYFQWGSDTAGYVKHEAPQTYTGMAAVSLAPFILNTGVAYTAFILSGGYAFYYGRDFLTHWEWSVVALSLWVGVSAALHAFPSQQDIHNIWNAAKAVWYQTEIPILQSAIAKLKSYNIALRVILLPITIPITAARATAFALWNYRVILSLPVIASLVILNKLKPFGSRIIFTVLIAASSYYTLGVMLPQVSPPPELVRQATDLIEATSLI
jgi:hypothetical protein